MRKDCSFRAKLQSFDAAGTTPVAEYFKKPIAAGRPKGSVAKRKRGRQRPAASENEEVCLTAKEQPPVPAPQLKTPKNETRGKTKADCSTAENIPCKRSSKERSQIA